MKYFLSAGEASGDLHASRLIRALKSEDGNAEFVFLGGDEMSREAGGKSPLIHYRDMAFMGFFEVARHLSTVLGNLKKARKALADERPDALILIDYPSFNLRLAKEAKRLGIPVFYYISPKVWAWKERRVKKIRRYVDMMLSILPFEPEWYEKRHGYEVTYVGNPSANEVDEKLRHISSREEFCRRHRLDPEKPILAIVPGSRRSEVKNNLPVMAEVASRHSELQPVIAGAPGLDDNDYEAYGNMKRISGDTFELMAHCRAALVTSGTATLEAALLAAPQVVCYRSNGSRIAYSLFKRILKIPFVSLPNLIAGREIVAEKLLHHCNADEIDEAFAPLTADSEERNAQLRSYRELRERLTDSDAAATAAAAIVKRLGK